mgnify:CR=1 FL=1
MSEPSRILAHAQNAAHVAEGLALVITQLRGKAAFEAVLSSWLTQVQAVEDALWSLYALAIDNSSAAALDQLGVILGQPRPVGLGDVPYRKVLHAATIALTSSGTGDELLAAMHALIGSWAFTMTPVYPATPALRAGRRARRARVRDGVRAATGEERGRGPSGGRCPERGRVRVLGR